MESKVLQSQCLEKGQKEVGLKISMTVDCSWEKIRKFTWKQISHGESMKNTSTNLHSRGLVMRPTMESTMESIMRPTMEPITESTMEPNMRKTNAYLFSP